MVLTYGTDDMKWIGKINWVWVIIVVAACYIAYVLGGHQAILDPPLIAILVGATNIVSLLEGRRQEREKINSNALDSHILSSDTAAAEPSNHGDNGRSGDEEHNNLSEDA